MHDEIDSFCIQTEKLTSILFMIPLYIKTKELKLILQAILLCMRTELKS